MEWEKAKTILIILLALLNAGLFAMGVYGMTNYKMTLEDVSAISTILSKSDITLNCNVPIENTPMRLMSLQGAEWDYDYIKNTFFPDEVVTRTLEQGSILYRSEDNSRVVIVEGADKGNLRQLIYTEESASRSEPEEYIALLGKDFGRFELKRAVDDEYGRSYLYNEVVNGSVIFASEAEVLYLGGGVSLRVKKLDFVSYIAGTHEIFRADEALLTFMHYKNENIEGPVTIEAIQLGYGVESGFRETTLKAKPYYRLFIKDAPEPVLIDAVMNTVLQ